MPELERKTIPFEGAHILVNPDENKDGEVKGYGSTFNNWDSYGDTIVPGAYEKTIPKFLKSGFISWSHDWAFPVATPEVLREDSKGLWLEGIFHSDSESQRIRLLSTERLERGKSLGLSIGYFVEKWEAAQTPEPYRTWWGGLTDEGRKLLEIDLKEVGIVMVPADQHAQVTDVKAGGMTFQAELDRALAAWDSVVGRSKSLVDLRKAEGKAGRTLSRVTREKLSSSLAKLDELRAEIDDLLKNTDVDPEDTDNVEKAQRIYMEFLQEQAKFELALTS